MSKEDGVSYRSFNIVGKKQLAPLKAGYTIADMKSGICIPSSVHGYSLAVEYYRDWFLSKFDKNYFKTVFINGRHILQDYMRYSEVSMLKQAKPAVAITPIANFEHDRETQDSYMGGVDMLIGKFNHQQGFFKDYEKNIFVGMGSRELEVEFASRVRVETRAQQMDIYRHMEIACRIGYTNMEYISADFHIPYDIIKNIAVAAGFKLNKDEEVEDVVNFVKYLNAHSEMPILYKLRTMTGKSEYFVRVNRVLAHIINSDKLNKDDIYCLTEYYEYIALHPNASHQEAIDACKYHKAKCIKAAFYVSVEWDFGFFEEKIVDKYVYLYLQKEIFYLK